uniref:membrane-bound transcription factor site-2 protease-like isoform X2 n=1 Tax=Styela clava TaxID=7725 RepID=UPI001939EAF2|nr:membrane-bound transcription factor site-2 protease-like isoform X2 [Styela clava]
MTYLGLQVKSSKKFKSFDRQNIQVDLNGSLLCLNVTKLQIKIMSPSTFVAILLGVWSTFHLAHNFLLNSSTFGHHVSSFLINYNVSISLFHIRWFTAGWNRFFIKIGRMCTSKLKLWFDAGVFLAVLTMFVGTILLCHTLYVTILQIFFKPEKPVPDQQVLSVIVPGINMPIHDIWYLLSSIFLSGILHEFGHAIAAAREDDMSRKSPLCQLRVYCAGVWHNFVICVAACGLIVLLPGLLFPFYTSKPDGVLVTHQMPESPLQGSMGLRAGDHVLMIDSCKISNKTDWFQCINKTKKSAQWGSCVSKKKIDSVSSHTVFTVNNPNIQSSTSHRHYWMDCCDIHAPQTHLCYKYTTIQSNNTMYACLPGRVMISTLEDCVSTKDCHTNKDEDQDDIVCAKAHTEPGVKFIRITTLRQGLDKHNVLYIGDPADIVRSVTVSDLFPRYTLIPPKLPSIILRFLQYMFSMSGALALLNIVPCYALDGQWAFRAFLNYFASDEKLSQVKKEMICQLVLLAGTSLLAANIFFGFVHLFTR